MKTNIQAVGVLQNGLTLYSFNYDDEVKTLNTPVYVGIMSDEVEKVFPYAVKTLDDGYKIVNYGLLP